MTESVKCPDCGGSRRIAGHIKSRVCRRCDGSGTVPRAHTTVYELGDMVVGFAEELYGQELMLWQRRVLREVLVSDPDTPLLLSRLCTTDGTDRDIWWCEPHEDMAMALTDPPVCPAGMLDKIERGERSCRMVAAHLTLDPRNENYAEGHDQEKHP